MTGWAILGTGDVARKFAQGLDQLGPAAAVRVVASRDHARASRFAAACKGSVAAQSYAAAIARADVDAVYIALPPVAHEAHALAAIAAGKAVLIEKPFAPDAAAARRIAAAATAAGVFCMEAMWTRFLPLMTAVEQVLQRGEIGECRSLSGSFSLSNQPDPATSLFDPAQGGGALLHRAIYPVSLARHLLGPVIEVTARGRIGPTGVDEECTLILRHASGALSTLTAGLRGAGRNDLLISGTLGLLRIAPPVFRPFSATLSRTTPRPGPRQGQGSGASAGSRLTALREHPLAHRLHQMLPEALRGLASLASLASLGGGTRRIRRPYAGNGYHYEAAEVARMLALGQTESGVMPLAQSIEIMDILDAARAQMS